MQTAVITGGTDGIGRALADVYLRRGYRVLIVGRDAEKGRDFVAAASRAGAGDRVRFLSADLSLISHNRDLVQRIAQDVTSLDLLVLGARYHRPARTLTVEGFESNFALFYLSRFILSHGLAEQLVRASQPVILNFAACGLTGPVRWDDLQLERDYQGVGAMGHGGRLNDLLGAGYRDVHPESQVSYVLNHPGVVATSFAGEYDPATAARVAALKSGAKTVQAAVREIQPHLDSPIVGGLTVVVEGRRVPADAAAFDQRDAARLDSITRHLLGPAGGRRSPVGFDAVPGAFPSGLEQKSGPGCAI